MRKHKEQEQTNKLNKTKTKKKTKKPKKTELKLCCILYSLVLKYDTINKNCITC